MNTTIGPEQINYLHEEFERWGMLARSTEPVDMPKIHALVAEVYGTTGLFRPPPERVALCASPAEMVIKVKLMQQKGNVPIPFLMLRDHVRKHDSAQSTTRADIRSILWGQRLSWGQTRTNTAPWGNLNNEVYNAIVSTFTNAISTSSMIEPRNTNEQHWAAYALVLDKLGLLGCADQIEPIAHLSAECGWWLAFDDVCYVMDRPAELKLDDTGRLHCDHAPAIRYRDDWGVYSWHGIGFPEEWLGEFGLTPGIALRQENIERRRVACEILGWDSILHELGARTVDRDPNPQIGTLLAVVIPGDRWSRFEDMFLRVQCGTGRTFALPVPPDMRTARQANAWTYGLAANDYDPEVRT